MKVWSATMARYEFEGLPWKKVAAKLNALEQSKSELLETLKVALEFMPEKATTARNLVNDAIKKAETL